VPRPPPAAVPAAGAGDVHGGGHQQGLCSQHTRAGTGSAALDGQVSGVGWGSGRAAGREGGSSQQLCAAATVLKSQERPHQAERQSFGIAGFMGGVNSHWSGMVWLLLVTQLGHAKQGWLQQRLVSA